jgi:hypothetical protein
MGQWVSLGEFRTLISSRVLKGLGCEFQPELDKGGPDCAKSLHNQG